MDLLLAGHGDMKQILQSLSSRIKATPAEPISACYEISLIHIVLFLAIISCFFF